MKRRGANLLFAFGFLVLTGCAGTGEVIPLQVRPILEKAAQPAQDIRVSIGPFEDGREFRTGLGTRTHLWGGVSYFDIKGGDPGDVVSQALTEYLTSKGWHITKFGSNEESDVTLTGKIQELFVHAKSRFGSTELTAKTKFAMRATNTADGSIVRMTLNGSGEEDVFWFDNEDMEAVLNEVLTDSFSKLIQDTKVENKMLRLKQQ
ncbi:YajG family lipoprotein [Petrachloros mirabilis]